MNIEFEKNKLLGSILAFSRNFSLIKEDSKNFINQNEIDFSSFNFDNILYLRQILHFSKLKYINSNFEKIEESISKKFENSPIIAEFYLNKLNIQKNIPISFLSNLENLYFDMMINLKNIKTEKDISLISGNINLYAKRLKELCEIISDSQKSKKNSSQDRYENLISFRSPHFSGKDFESTFELISSPLKNGYKILANNIKCVKIQKPEQNFIKSQEFLSGLDDFLKNHFDFKYFFKENKNSSYYLFSNFEIQNNENEIDFKNLLYSKIKNILANFRKNLSNLRNKESNFLILFDDFEDNGFSSETINNFILNFYSNSQFFIENLLHFLKKTFKIKGKAFESKNIFWLLNCMNNENSLNSELNQELCSNEISSILFQIIQYVIEKDFINNSEHLNLDDLISAWQSGVKHYFDYDVSPLNFIKNFNFNPFECGSSGLKIFSTLKASEFYNKFSHESGGGFSSGEANENKSFLNIFKDVFDFEEKFLFSEIKDLKTKDSKEIIFSEYTKYLKNKFGIII